MGACALRDRCGCGGKGNDFLQGWIADIVRTRSFEPLSWLRLALLRLRRPRGSCHPSFLRSMRRKKGAKEGRGLKGRRCLRRSSRHGYISSCAKRVNWDVDKSSEGGVVAS